MNPKPMITRAHPLTRWTGSALTLAALVPADAWALECAPVPGTSAMPAMTSCVHGLPVRQGELLLIPRVCRLTVAGKPVERHTVDVRHGETGAKIGTASLPPQAPGSGPAVPGTVLTGEPPLLVTPEGIAAVEPRRGVVEPSFTPEGRLVGVARRGDVLVVVEALAPDKTFPAGSLALTAMDQEAGELLGEAHLAGTSLATLELRGGTGKTLDVWLGRQEKDKAMVLAVPVRDAAGKALAKNGVLSARLQAVVGGAVAAGPGCPMLGAPDVVMVGESKLTVADGRVKAATGQLAATWVPGAAGDTCAAVTATGTGDTATSAAWIQTAGSGAALQIARCRK